MRLSNITIERCNFCFLIPELIIKKDFFNKIFYIDYSLKCPKNNCLQLHLRTCYTDDFIKQCFSKEWIEVDGLNSVEQLISQWNERCKQK